MFGLNGYICFYKQQKIEVWANTQLDALKAAARDLGVKPKYQHLISVNLCQCADGTEVVHTPSF